MAIAMFIDNQPDEIIRYWELAKLDNKHKMIPVTVFQSIIKSLDIIQRLDPDVIFVGFDLSPASITGVDVVIAIRKIGYQGLVIANSADGPGVFETVIDLIDYTANRDPQIIKLVLECL